jgi:phage terminase large subunit
MRRPKYLDLGLPTVLGVDPARGGADSTVIAVRRGRDLVALRRFKGEDTMTVVGHVIDAIEEYRPILAVIDEGGLGYGVLDRLREQGYVIRGVNFGGKTRKPLMWGNKRAEIWGAMREWLRSASVPNDRLLKSDLVGPRKKPNSSGTMFLEGKKDMKARGLASPDAADALACTFAFPVMEPERQSVDARAPVAYAGDNSVAHSWMGA